MTLQQKLDPRRTKIEPVLGAIVGYIIGVSWVTEPLRTLSITSDGFLLSENYFFGRVDEFVKIFEELLDYAKVTEKQHEQFWQLFKQRVGDFRL
jgi:hypothetical protein